MTPTDSRSEILRRIRAARRDQPATVSPEQDHSALPRDYRTAQAERTPRETADLLARHLADYRAHVHRTEPGGLPATIAALLTAHGSQTVTAPPGVPRDWLGAVRGARVLLDPQTLTAAELDAVDTVVTGCALAIAETGTIVLDASPDQGQRRLTLVPDHHVCVVYAPDQIVAGLPQALPRLDPTRPLTWISGPSATSDIELDRVEGVHGPRTLDVVIVTAG